jgi:hypothetical protein
MPLKNIMSVKIDAVKVELKGVNEIIPVFSTFSSQWITFDIEST